MMLCFIPMTPAVDRRTRLAAAVKAYFDGLKLKDLSNVPWAADVTLRTPLAPGGLEAPLKGRDEVVSFFNSILPAISAIEVIDQYWNETLTAVMAKANVGLANGATLRVADLFVVDETGGITVQENHYDPRPAAPDVAALEAELNRMILAGQIMEAYERFYADDVIMQENASEPCRGKAANRDRQFAYFASVSEFHSAKLTGSAVSGERSYSEWEYDATYKSGVRYTIRETSARQWSDGKVVLERFYWDPSSYPAPV